MNRLIPCVLFIAALTATAHSQCFTCALPEAISPSVIADICDTLAASRPQREELDRVHDAYSERWHLVQTGEVAELAAASEQGAARLETPRDWAAYGARMWRRVESIELTLQRCDRDLFANISRTLSGAQLDVLPVWVSDQQSRWYTMGMQGRIQVESPLATIPQADESPERRRAILANLKSMMLARARQLRLLSRAARKEMLALLDAIGQGDVEPGDLEPKLTTIDLAFKNHTMQLSAGNARTVAATLGLDDLELIANRGISYDPPLTGTIHRANPLDPLTGEQFRLLCQVLTLDADDDVAQHLFEAAVKAHQLDPVINAGYARPPRSADGSITAALHATWAAAKRSAMHRADAIDAELIEHSALLVSDPTIDARAALSQLLCRSWRRDEPLDDRLMLGWTSQSRRVILTEAVLRSRLDLREPARVGLLLEYARSVAPRLEAEATARRKRFATPGAPRPTAGRLAEARLAVQTDFAESLQGPDRFRWDATINRLSWPQVTRPLDLARGRVAQELANPTLSDTQRRDLKDRFADRVGHATVLEDRMLTLLAPLRATAGLTQDLARYVQLDSLRDQQRQLLEVPH
jgi:hypothetical protein